LRVKVPNSDPTRTRQLATRYLESHHILRYNINKSWVSLCDPTVRVVLWNEALQDHLHLIERGVCISKNFLHVDIRYVVALTLRYLLELVGFGDLRLDRTVCFRRGLCKFLVFSSIALLSGVELLGLFILSLNRHSWIHQQLQSASVAHARLGELECVGVIGHCFEAIRLKKVFKTPERRQVSSSLLQGDREVTRVVDRPTHVRFSLLVLRS
jgi:hypothetical protein